LFEKGGGHKKLHTKALFPEEPGFWEQSWFDREEAISYDVTCMGEIKIGVLLCTEMWFTQYARQYGTQGADLLLCPRATGKESTEKWIRCGQTLAVISGAWCLSSNRAGSGADGFAWGGAGWIAEPVTGKLAGQTTSDQNFLTVEIDIGSSRLAKTEYPLYVRE
ncbi:MAG TPA: carbon-nitrogen hydrolase family protein, partial [Chitinophagaceae bacterium]